MTTPARQLQDDQERLLHVLEREMAWRPQRTGERHPSLDSMGRDIVIAEWIAKERDALRNTVNDIRVERSMQPLYTDSITRAEERARGHSDYASKLALYCAELCQPDRTPHPMEPR